MLFNSYAFLFGFLPGAVLGYFVFGRLGKTWGAGWLAACSLVFYGWWNAHYLWLLGASIGGNFLAGATIARHAGQPAGRRWLAAAVAANLLLLGYYKYADFFLGSLDAALGARWPLPHVLLPIGISFFTFTQIAFLADACAGKVREYRFVQYLLFVSYFPHLIAGPVLHHKEMMPQFDDDRKYRASGADFAVGATILAIGLAKKVLLADNLARYAEPLFSPQSGPASLFLAWGGALAYAFQLYFDFSGYSDMAIGLSRLFGVKLPLNFDSPYKARDIADFWRRWHMTLSRFLRDYLYIPLGGNRRGPLRQRLNLMTTMVLGGLWHGAGWNFVVWGAMHGAFLVVHQVWRTVSGRWRVPLPPRLAAGLAAAATFVCVVFAWVYFRAPDLATANRVVIGMLGGHGAEIPQAVMSHLGPLQAGLRRLGVGSFLGGGGTFIETWCWVAAAAALAFAAPNTQQIMCRFEPALVDARRGLRCAPPGLAWLPTRRSAVLLGLLFGFGILALSRPTQFLYFQF